MQTREGRYIFLCLVAAVGAIAVVMGTFPYVSEGFYQELQTSLLVGLGGFLGGIVYSGKWLYHTVARGLWHQDRQLWRRLSPWLSFGTTLGIWGLVNVGFFPAVSTESLNRDALVGFVGIGFVTGYLADRFLAKMTELIAVLFGQAEMKMPSQLTSSPNGDPEPTTRIDDSATNDDTAADTEDESPPSHDQSS